MGVTALFAEYTGTQQPLDIDWSLEGGVRTTATLVESIAAEDAPLTAAKSSEPLQQRTADILVEGTELRRLLGTMRFRTVLNRLNRDWRERLLHVMTEGSTVSDHLLKRGRQTIHLRELSYQELDEMSSKTSVPDAIRPDLDLLLAVGRLWGAEAVKRLRFADVPERHEPFMMDSLLRRLRD